MATSYIKTENRGSVSVTVDGVKTYAELFAELYALIDSDKVKRNTILRLGGSIYSITAIGSSDYRFGNVSTSDVQIVCESAVVGPISRAHFWKFSVNSSGNISYNDATNNVPSSGYTILLSY